MFGNGQTREANGSQHTGLEKLQRIAVLDSFNGLAPSRSRGTSFEYPKIHSIRRAAEMFLFRRSRWWVEKSS